MNAQELTTGNVVGVTHDKWGDMPAIVTSINIEGDLSLRLLGVPRAYEEYKCVLTEVFPIRITEKILLHNGFILPEHKEFYVLHRINNGDNAIRLTKGIDSWTAEFFVSHPEEVMLTPTIKNINYLHELQNAFKLTAGQDLPLKI